MAVVVVQRYRLYTYTLPQTVRGGFVGETGVLRGYRVAVCVVVLRYRLYTYTCISPQTRGLAGLRHI